MRWINSASRAAKLSKIAIVSLFALGLTACQTTSKQQIGTIGGAILGGLVGAQFGKGKGAVAATAAGALIGAMIGRDIGAELDELDRRKLADAQIEAASAPMGEEISWDNPNSGNYGRVKTVREGRQASSGRYCREFHNTVVIDGEEHEEVGQACQNNDGSWEIVS